MIYPKNPPEKIRADKYYPMMFYLCYNGVIFSSKHDVIVFQKSSEVELITVEHDYLNRCEYVTYPEGITYADLPVMKVLDEELASATFDYEGKLDLAQSHTINGLRFYLKLVNNEVPQSYIFSCFIDADVDTIKFEWNNHGAWVRIPATYAQAENFNEVLLSALNSSPLFYVEGTFRPANIIGVDLKAKKVKTNWKNAKPYSNYPKLYVNEADVIASFIHKMSQVFPEIDFYPQSYDKGNLGRESCFYAARLSRDVSDKHNSVVVKHPNFERYYVTTIPIEMRYQTNDVAQYSNRRSMYLLSRFFQDVYTFDVIVDRGYPDRFGETKELFHCGVYWSRDVEDQLIKMDSADSGGRDTYTLTMLCDLTCTLLQSSEASNIIQDVIMDIYFDGGSSL